MQTIDNPARIAALTVMFQGYLTAQGLPQMSADELLAMGTLNAEQSATVREFVALWDEANEANEGA